MTDAVVTLDRSGSVATLALHRPDSRNALTDEVCLALIDRLIEIERADDIDVVVVRGTGPIFCAGGDIKIPSALVTGSPAERRRMADRWQEVYDRLDRLAQPTVVRLSGAAVGGGALLAMACDLRIADETAWLAFPEAAMGRYLMAGGPARLVAEIGPSRARDLLLTGRRLDAVTAEAWGVVNRLVPADELDDAVDELASSVAAVSPEVAAPLRRSLRAAAGGLGSSWPDAFLSTVDQ